eukprot:scaffold1671_cov344-Pavlova_lutheri.AAC.38
MDPRRMDAPMVELQTSMGTFAVELYVNEAPKTCHNFVELSRSGYYDGVVFHRIIRDFMVQGGDPTGTGRGGTSVYGGTFEDEITNALKHTGAGVLSMANAGPNTNRSQVSARVVPKRSWTRTIPHVEADRGSHAYGAVLHHLGTHTFPRWQAHHLWQGLLWHGSGAKDGSGRNRS